MNKITLMLAGLCLCGAAMAQGTSVDGSNTAVVIRKAPVYSADSNYQLLVVPVKALDITASATDTAVSLADMLPPASYLGYKVTPLSADGTSGSVTYTATQATDGTTGETTYAWTPSDGTSPAELAPGAIFWLKKPASTATGTTLSTGGFGGFASLATTTESTATTTDDSPIVFCGQANSKTIDWNSLEPDKMIALGNSTSDAIVFGSEDLPATAGAQLFRVQSGSTDYQLYRVYMKGGRLVWCKAVVELVDLGNGTTVPYTSWEAVAAPDNTIPAAEAFYYVNLSL